MKVRRLSASLAVAWWMAASGRVLAAAYAGSSEAGELELPGSALAVVAGSATPGLSRDALAVRENPARLGEAGTAGAAATYALHAGGLTDSQIAAYIGQGSAGVFGASLRLVQASIPITLEDGAGGYGGTQGHADVQTIVGTFGWAPDLSLLAESLGTAVRAGLSATFLNRDMAGQGEGGAGGGAAVWVPCGRGMSAFGIVRNVGWTESWIWPVEASAGAAVDWGDVLVSGAGLRGSLAGTWSRERGVTGAAGIEYGIGGGDLVGAAIRAGYEIGTVRALGKWPSGGLAVRIGGLSVEIGIGSMGGLGLERIVTLSYRESAAGG